MGVEKLLEKLKKHLDKGEKNKTAVRCEQVDSILEKLSKKEHKLKEKLAGEKDKSKRKHISLELRMISRQRKKGIKRRKELKDKCK